MPNAPIDRIAPTRRPDGRPVGYQEWRDLLFLHWPVPVDEVRAVIPPELEPDLLDGVAFAGLVPFAMRGVRPAGCPRRLGFDFFETNVRLYVLHRGEPGVYFCSLDASSRIAVRIARWRWSLPYFDAEMSGGVAEGDAYRYRSRRRGGKDGSLDVRFRVGEELGPSRRGSAEFFLLERYLLFTRRRGKLYRGQVSHAPYPARRAEVDHLEEDLLEAAELTRPGDSPPSFVHFSPGVDVEIFPLRRTT